MIICIKSDLTISFLDRDSFFLKDITLDLVLLAKRFVSLIITYCEDMDVAITGIIVSVLEAMMARRISLPCMIHLEYSRFGDVVS